VNGGKGNLALREVRKEGKGKRSGYRAERGATEKRKGTLVSACPSGGVFAGKEKVGLASGAGVRRLGRRGAHLGGRDTRRGGKGKKTRLFSEKGHDSLRPRQEGT